MMNPSKEREQELVEIFCHGITDEGRDPDEYHSWDDMIECDDVMTYEEWCYISSNYAFNLEVIPKKIN